MWRWVNWWLQKTSRKRERGRALVFSRDWNLCISKRNVVMFVCGYKYTHRIQHTYSITYLHCLSVNNSAAIPTRVIYLYFFCYLLVWLCVSHIQQEDKRAALSLTLLNYRVERERAVKVTQSRQEWQSGDWTTIARTNYANIMYVYILLFKSEDVRSHTIIITKPEITKQVLLFARHSYYFRHTSSSNKRVYFFHPLVLDCLPGQSVDKFLVNNSLCFFNSWST